MIEASTCLKEGSSPLARGLLQHRQRHQRRHRIIPARAGFTRSAGRRRGSRRDHPRSRGVYRSYTRTTQTDSGSSPLARGLRPGRGWRVRATGIIPARAGFTRPARELGKRSRDHPRSRGVYQGRAVRPRAGRGSSPLARGLRTGIQTAVMTVGIIPARAGFTRQVAQGHRRHADHPRSRGVYSTAARFMPAW